MTGTVLDQLYRMVKGRDHCRITSSIEDKKTGRKIGFRGHMMMDFGEEASVVLTGFKYLPDKPETIGVMEKLAKIGAAEDRIIIIYFADREFHRSLVFHPQAFVAHGIEEVKQEERQERGERWLNLDRDWACTLREYAEGSDEPQVEPTKRQEVERDGGWFSV
jgi:hypothetical protein